MKYIIAFLIGFIIGIFGFMIYQSIKYIPVYTDVRRQQAVQEELLECRDIKEAQSILIINMAEDCGK